MFSPYFNPYFKQGDIKGTKKYSGKNPVGEDVGNEFDNFELVPEQPPVGVTPGDKYDTMPVVQEDQGLMNRIGTQSINPYYRKEGTQILTPPTATEAGEMGLFPPGAPMAQVSNNPLNVPVYNPQNIAPPAPSNGPQMFQKEELVEPVDTRMLNPVTGLPETRVVSPELENPLNRWVDENGVRVPLPEEVRPDMEATGGVTMPEGTGKTMINFQNPYVKPPTYDMSKLMPESLRGNTLTPNNNPILASNIDDQEITGIPPSDNLAWNKTEPPTTPETVDPKKAVKGITQEDPILDEEDPTDPEQKRLSNKIIPPINQKNLPYNNGGPEINTGLPQEWDTRKTNFEDVPGLGSEGKKKGFTPEMYYGIKGAMDAGALFNNIIQAPPPTIQYKLPQADKLKMDRTAYEQQRTAIEGSVATSMRSLRNFSQVGDIIKGASAISAGTQDALSQVGTAEAQQEDNLNQYNQGVANQLNAQQAQVINKEAVDNYTNQAQAQKEKNAQVSQALATGLDTAGKYANFLHSKDERDRLEALNKEQVDNVNSIQMAWLKAEAGKAEMGTPQYKASMLAGWEENINKLGQETLDLDEYADLKAQYGDDAPDYATYQDKLYSNAGREMSQIAQAGTMFEKMYPNGEPQSGDYTSEDQYKYHLQQYNSGLPYYEEYSKDPKYKNWTLEQNYWQKVRSGINYNQYQSDFADQYLKEKGLYSNMDLTRELEGLMGRS